jgi:hypothetical protein
MTKHCWRRSCFVLAVIRVVHDARWSSPSLVGKPGQIRLKRPLLLAVALLALGGGIAGCGETKAEEETTAKKAAQEEKATAQQEKREEQQHHKRELQEQHEEAVRPTSGSGSSSTEASGRSSGEHDEVGSPSHSTDSQFCSEHHCIGSFTTEGGTIVECSDGSYSHAGGISGACSSHGGEN